MRPRIGPKLSARLRHTPENRRVAECASAPCDARFESGDCVPSFALFTRDSLACANRAGITRRVSAPDRRQLVLACAGWNGGKAGNAARPIKCACKCASGRKWSRKSKWGRHFCRPHSHQRVGASVLLSVWQASPSASVCALGARCLTRVRLCWLVSPLAGSFVPAPPCFAVRHRRSHRHPTLLRDHPFGFKPGPSPLLTAPSQSRDRNPLVADGSNTERSVLESSFLQLSPTGIVARTMTSLSHFPQTIRFASC